MPWVRRARSLQPQWKGKIGRTQFMIKDWLGYLVIYKPYWSAVGSLVFGNYIKILNPLRESPDVIFRWHRIFTDYQAKTSPQSHPILLTESRWKQYSYCLNFIPYMKIQGVIRLHTGGSPHFSRQSRHSYFIASDKKKKDTKKGRW